MLTPSSDFPVSCPLVFSDVRLQGPRMIMVEPAAALVTSPRIDLDIYLLFSDLGFI